MSLPSFPSMTPNISISTAQTIPLLLGSIALEELALAHLVNAEAEGLQFILGTLTPTNTNFTPANVSLSNFLTANASVQRTLRDVIKKEMLLEFKFENVLDLIANTTTPPFACDCSATLNFSQVAPPSAFTQVLTGAICPGCEPTGSGFTFTRVSDFVVSFISNTITSVTCIIGDTNSAMEVTGTGMGTFNGTPFSSNFSLLLEDGSVFDTFRLVFEINGTLVEFTGISPAGGSIEITPCP